MSRSRASWWAAALSLVALACGGEDAPSSPVAPQAGAPAGGAATAGASGAGGATSGVAGAMASGGAGVAGNAGGADTGGGGGALGGDAGASSGAGTGGAEAGNGGRGEVTEGPRIPKLSAPCPKIEAGQIEVLGQQVRIWTGPAGTKGPLLFYWHGSKAEADQALVHVKPALDDIEKNGGVVASFTTSTDSGFESGPHVWHVGDFEMTDIIFACGVEQGLVEPRRVYTAGCSAGGLQSSVMVFLRSSYLAAAMPNSGGLLKKEWPLEDESRVPALITTHGGKEDFVGVSFAETTERLDRSISQAGGFVVDCDHGGGHCDSPAAVKAAQWRFLKAHPFGVKPEPYADGLPDDFPSICKLWK